MKPINIAILSCAHGHAKKYFDTAFYAKYRLCAISCDDKDKNQIPQALSHIPVYKTDNELYKNHPELEAVIIGSENIKHAQQTIDAAERGLHILSMKIPSFNLTEYDAMIAATEKAGVVCQVEMEMREHPEVHRVKEIIASGAIGDVVSITALNFSHNPVWWRPWQCNPEQSYGERVPLNSSSGKFRGGALADHPHIFDLVRFVLNTEFQSFYADVAPNMRDTETEDLVYIIGRLKNGAILSLDPSYANSENKVKTMQNWELSPKAVEVTMTVHGTLGSIIADVYGMRAYHTGKPSNFYLVEWLEYKGYVNRQMSEFYECIRQGKKPTVGLREHRQTIEAMNACYHSISSGQPVKL